MTTKTKPRVRKATAKYTAADLRKAKKNEYFRGWDDSMACRDEPPVNWDEATRTDVGREMVALDIGCFARHGGLFILEALRRGREMVWEDLEQPPRWVISNPRFGGWIQESSIMPTLPPPHVPREMTPHDIGCWWFQGGIEPIDLSFMRRFRPSLWERVRGALRLIKQSHVISN